ncbi:MAG: alpha/beta fold hydrolase [Pseudomonadota bacterium]
MKLHCQIYPESLDPGDLSARTPLILIPGLFGSTTNWRGFARQYAANMGEQHPAIILDMRNHGRSPHADSHSYADMVADLAQFFIDHGIQQADVCGHSMGGKVAMLFALQHSLRVRRLAVLDIAPVSYGHSPAPFLPDLIQLPVNEMKSRAEADRALQPIIADTPTRLFVLQSLSGSPGAYYWRLNLSVLQNYMEQITGFPEVNGQVQTPTLFVNGQQSDYLLNEHHDKILGMFPNTQFQSIPEAGHWLHADQPKRVLEVVSEFLKL